MIVSVLIVSDIRTIVSDILFSLLLVPTGCGLGAPCKLVLATNTQIPTTSA